MPPPARSASQAPGPTGSSRSATPWAARSSWAAVVGETPPGPHGAPRRRPAAPPPARRGARTRPAARASRPTSTPRPARLGAGRGRRSVRMWAGEPLDLGPRLVDARAGEGRRRHDRHGPPGVLGPEQVHRVAVVGDGPAGRRLEVAVGLVDDDDVGQLHDPALDALQLVAAARRRRAARSSRPCRPPPSRTGRRRPSRPARRRSPRPRTATPPRGCAAPRRRGCRPTETAG